MYTKTLYYPQQIVDLDCNLSYVSFSFLIYSEGGATVYHQQGGSRNFFEGGSVHSRYWVGDDF